MNRLIAWSVFGGLVLACAPLATAALTVKAIAVGGGYAFALASDGTVWTWGQVPVQVSGISGVVAISVGGTSDLDGRIGNRQCLAVKNDGTVWAWDINGSVPYDPNNPNATFTPTAPAQVKGLSGAIAISGGYAHALVLKSDGTVWGWGALRDGTTIPRTTPTQVSGLTGVIGIAAGMIHSLAVKDDGTVWAWGDNQWGQLGNGTITPGPNLPVQVTGLAGVVAVAAGYFHSLALKGDGTIWAWGHYGPSLNVGPTPQQVGLIGGVVAISATEAGNRAVKDDGTLWQWPTPDLNHTIQLTPLQIAGLTGVQAAAGNLALKRDGTVWAWAPLASGLWGDGLPAIHVAPTRISGLAGVVSASARPDGGLALDGDGTVWEWTRPSEPARVSGLSGAAAVAAGSAHSLALLNDGTVWEWIAASAPAPVADLTDVQAIAAGAGGSLALKRDGTVWKWSGQSTPVQVSELSGVVAIGVASGWDWWDGAWYVVDGLALRNDGTVWALGWTRTGKPSQVPELTDITSIAAGEISLAIKADGTVWEWDQTMGMGTWAPIQAEDLTGAKALAVGAREPWGLEYRSPHCLALKNDGTVWAEGSNFKGQLGDGTTIRRDTAVQVAGLSGMDSISAAGYHSLAVKRDGTVWEWGDTGAGTTRPAPVQVIQPGSPDLAIEMQHSGNFTVGDSGEFTVAITNMGLTATTGAITVVDTLPAGLTHVSSGGNGWSCLPDGQVITCTNLEPIGPGASSVINLTVRVEAQAWPGVTNLAAVSNESDRNMTNNIIGDPTVVLGGERKE